MRILAVVLFSAVTIVSCVSPPLGLSEDYSQLFPIFDAPVWATKTFLESQAVDSEIPPFVDPYYFVSSSDGPTAIVVTLARCRLTAGMPSVSCFSITELLRHGAGRYQPSGFQNFKAFAAKDVAASLNFARVVPSNASAGACVGETASPSVVEVTGPFSICGGVSGRSAQHLPTIVVLDVWGDAVLAARQIAVVSSFESSTTIPFVRIFGALNPGSYTVRIRVAGSDGVVATIPISVAAAHS